MKRWTTLSLAGAFWLSATTATWASGADELASPAYRGDVPALERAIGSGPIDQPDMTGYTPLMWATQAGHQEVVQWLLAHGADPSRVNDQGASALVIAKRYGRSAIIDALEQAVKKAPPAAPIQRTADSRLLRAAHDGNLAAAEAALKAGAAVNARDVVGNTPLIWAVQRKQPTMVRFLLAHGADPALTNEHGRRPRDLAIGPQQAAMVASLEAQVARVGNPAPSTPAGTPPVSTPSEAAAGAQSASGETKAPTAASPVDVASSAGRANTGAPAAPVPTEPQTSPSIASDETGSVIGQALVTTGKVGLWLFTLFNGESWATRAISGGLTAASGAFITNSDERAIGLNLANQALTQTPAVQSKALQAYINQVGQRVVQQCDRRDLGYVFIATQSSDVNAFAAPGGFIFVTAGALAKMHNESELAAVLGHEVAHVTRRHGVSKVQAAYVAMGAAEAASGSQDALIHLGTVVAGELLLKGYSRELEHEADWYGATYAFRAGYHPQGMIDFFQTLMATHGETPSWLVGLASHPETMARIDKVGSFIAQQGAMPAPLPAPDERFQAQIARWLAEAE